MDRVTSWRDEAACIGVDPEIFFPLGSSAVDPDLKAAKQVCGRCTVKAACLEWAVQASVDDGVFGGLDAQERRSLTNRSRRRFRRLPSTPGDE